MRWGLLSLLFFVPACAHVTPGAWPTLPLSERPCVFVADGAGDFRACSGVFRQTANDDGMSLEVVTFVWSHGYLRNVADQTDTNHIQKRGQLLAELVKQRREKSPDAPITLVGHSAGSAVVLAAAERLPANTVDRIMLLSPSLSDGYDLRPALAASRKGIDAFVSDGDWFWLGVLVRILGTPDDPHAVRASGRFGFKVYTTGPSDCQLYAKLRLHQWSNEQKVLGNDGGHFGAYQPDFLRNMVFPLIGKNKE